MKMVVGLTGGVASGKSLVSGEFKKLGALIIDADAVAREITVKGTPVYAAIVREFGGGILKEDGSIDRKALGRIVFSDGVKLSLLNKLTHPEIIARIRRGIEELKKNYPDPLIVVDAALLIEAGLHREMDRVIVVYADTERQTERVMKRDGLTREEAKERINAQMPIGEKVRLADYVIDNNNGIDRAVTEARAVYEKLKNKPATGGRGE